MPDRDKIITAFSELGKVLRSAGNGPVASPEEKKLNQLIETVQQYNGWFTPAFVKNALNALGESLQKEKPEKWMKPYKNQLSQSGSPKTVAVIMAGNVPAVGFHDFLSVLISGHNILAKLSSDDDKLLPAIADILIKIEPLFAERIGFTGEQIKNFDAVIATGSNNTSRYFEYYFGKYPNIIRRNRNGVAVVNGSETEEELNALADDVFMYYGLGCRNVARIFVPAGYDFTMLQDVFAKRKEIIENNKYFNNYEYNKAIFLVNGTKHFDTGNLLMTEKDSFSSPVSVLHYSYYQDEDAINNELMLNSNQIQCVASNMPAINNKTPLGKTQSPELWDYADGIDTIKFLLSIG
jgi:hypothetical protein